MGVLVFAIFLKSYALFVQSLYSVEQGNRKSNVRFTQVLWTLLADFRFNFFSSAPRCHITNCSETHLTLKEGLLCVTRGSLCRNASTKFA